mmetsp:Transcript_16896/g.34310  ORF Transcript_16896/g.34310 Transcript_16896/m.34310 type:complete len:191 (-) Transcript_16896:558-1130(-)
MSSVFSSFPPADPPVPLFFSFLTDPSVHPLTSSRFRCVPRIDANRKVHGVFPFLPFVSSLSGPHDRSSLQTNKQASKKAGRQQASEGAEHPDVHPDAEKRRKCGQAVIVCLCSHEYLREALPLKSTGPPCVSSPHHSVCLSVHGIRKEESRPANRDATHPKSKRKKDGMQVGLASVYHRGVRTRHRQPER